MNEHEIIHLIQEEEKKLHEGVDSFSDYLIICNRLDTLKDQLIEVISSKKLKALQITQNNMMKTKTPPAKKAKALAKAKKAVRKTTKKKVVTKKK